MTWNIREAALDLVCPSCGARPGEACRTVGGSNAINAHVARLGPLSIAFGEGYREGRAGAEWIAAQREARRSVR